MIKPVPKRTFVYGAALALAIGGIGAGLSVLHGTAAEGPMVEIPIFEVDPLWPKPLPEEASAGDGHRRFGRRPGQCLDRPSRRLDAQQQ